jgi:hypothetical protein
LIIWKAGKRVCSLIMLRGQDQRSNYLKKNLFTSKIRRKLERFYNITSIPQKHHWPRLNYTAQQMTLSNLSTKITSQNDDTKDTRSNIHLTCRNSTTKIRSKHIWTSGVRSTKCRLALTFRSQQKYLEIILKSTILDLY